MQIIRTSGENTNFCFSGFSMNASLNLNIDSEAKI